MSLSIPDHRTKVERLCMNMADEIQAHQFRFHTEVVRRKKERDR